MPKCRSRNSVRTFQGVAVLLFVVFQFFPSQFMPGAIGEGESLQTMSESTSIALPKLSSLAPIGAHQNIVIDSEGRIIQKLSSGESQVVGQVPPRMLPKATTRVTMSGNLFSQALAGNPTTVELLSNPADRAISQFSVGFRVFDSQGATHDLTMYFTKNSANRWTYNVLANSSEVMVTEGNFEFFSGNALVVQGTIGFDTSGRLDTESALTYFNSGGTGINFSPPIGSVIPTAPILNQQIVFDFGTSITTDGGPGTDGMLQQGSASVLLTLSQDGFAPGTFNGITIVDGVDIVGHYSNGQTKVLGHPLPDVVQSPDRKKRRPHRVLKKHLEEHHSPPPVNFPDSMNVVQNGVWTVGQFGSWHVNIDNHSDHPVAVKDVSLSNKEPWAHTQSFQFHHDNSSAEDVLLTVPAGSRLFIQHVSLQTTAVGRMKSRHNPQVMASMHSVFNDSPITYHLGISDIFHIDSKGRQKVRHILSKPVQLFADANTQVRIAIERSFDGSQQEGMVSLTGYLEPMP